MRMRKRNIIQLVSTIFIIINCIIYFLYLKDFINFRLFSIGDLNPYGGWSALKALFIDVSYRWNGITRAIALTIALSFTSLLLGRFFCGSICPIGALQDFFKFVGNKIRIKERTIPTGKKFNLEMTKYIILFLILSLSILGFGNLLSTLSPWLGYLNLFSGLKLSMSIIILMIIISSLFIRRLFCRIFCPLGAFQALLYAMGPLKIHRDSECGSCTSCLKNCPVNLNNTTEHIISPECINCLICIDSKCIKGTDGYKLKFGKKSISSRKYILVSISLFIILYMLLPMGKTGAVTHTISDIYNLKDGKYIGIGTGFGGNIHTEIIIENKKIKNINVINHNETQGYYEEVFKEITKELIENQSLNIDAISGATVSSRGFINSIRGGIGQAIEN